MTRQRPRRHSVLFCLFFLLIPTLSSPLNAHDTTNNSNADVAGPPQPIAVADPGDNKTRYATSNTQDAGTGLMVSWLWGLVWGDDSTVSVVDRTPVLNFDARPAAFGPAEDVLGYLIRVEDFSVPCDGRSGGGDGDGDGGEPVGDEDGDVEDHRGNSKPWWPDDGREWEPMEHKLDARHGCPRLCMRGKDRPQSSETWMALVMRGGCTFVDKVRGAQRFGAKGVVVGGETEEQDRNGDGLVQMFSLGDSSDIQIPSTYITHQSYQSLSSLITSSNTSIFGLRTVSVGIVTDTSGWEWYSPLLTFLILLFLPSSLTLCTLLVHRVRAARSAQRERAPEDVVLNLPWRVWEGQETLWELEKSLEGGAASSARGSPNTETRAANPCEPSSSSPREAAEDVRPRVSDVGVPLEPLASSHAEEEAVETVAARKWYETQVECAICLEDFVKGDKVRVLPCRHIFHMAEVDDWLIHRKKLCPICKHDVTRSRSWSRSPSTTRSGPDTLNIVESSVSELQEDYHGAGAVAVTEARTGDALLSRAQSTGYVNDNAGDHDDEDERPTERTPLLRRSEGT